MKEALWLDALFTEWQNDCFMTNSQLDFHFLSDIHKKYTKLIIFRILLNTLIIKWENYCLIFYEKFQKCHTKLNKCCKRSFFYSMLPIYRKCWNDRFVTKWHLSFNFLCCILERYTKLNNFCKRVFFHSMLSFEIDKMTALWQNTSLGLTFYVIFSNTISNWTTFVTKMFRCVA